MRCLKRRHREKKIEIQREKDINRICERVGECDSVCERERNWETEREKMYKWGDREMERNVDIGDRQMQKTETEIQSRKRKGWRDRDRERQRDGQTQRWRDRWVQETERLAETEESGRPISKDIQQYRQ